MQPVYLFGNSGTYRSIDLAILDLTDIALGKPETSGKFDLCVTRIEYLGDFT